MKRLVFITSNSGKFAEVRKVLLPHGIEPVQDDIPCPEIQADSLDEVVSFCLDWLGDREEAYLIDDSGLFIDALSGFPGVYSAFVFKTLGNAGILKLMNGLPDEERSAHFETVFGVVGSGKKSLFRGRSDGRISHGPRGSGGFGYDPIFIPNDGDGRSFGEMSTEEKNRLSHRGAAVRNMLENLDRVMEIL